MELQEGILQFFERCRSDSLTLLLTSITILAEKGFLVIVLSILYWCVNKEKGKKLAWFVLFNTLGNSIIKNIVKMPRPYELGVVSPLRVQTATGYSFPSGHTQSATSFWGGGMVIFKTKASIILGMIMIVLTAISRMYLGVHWPMDVLGGIAFGFILIYFADKMLDSTKGITLNHILGTSLLYIVALLFNVRHDFYTAVAGIWGFCMGAFIEQQYIQFTQSTQVKTHLYRIIIGIVGILVLYIGIGKFLPHLKIVSMLKNALVMIWIMAGAPYFFKKFA